MTRKKRINNDLQLDGDQKLALGKFQKDFTRAMPHMVGMAQAAQRIHQDMVNAPNWRIADTPKPDEIPEPKMWSVGHAKVNYVDHIDTVSEGTQGK